MQPAILMLMIVSSAHVHKMVVDTKRGIGTYIKGKDELPNWLIASASQHDYPDERTTHNMTSDWKCGMDCMLPFVPGSP